LNQAKPLLSSKSLRAKAIALLARREHSAQELFQKLKPLAETPDQLPEIIEQLKSEGLLSDQRFVESVARVRGARFGSARILFELKNKGVDPQLLAGQSDSLRATEFERARLVWQKRFGSPPVTAKEHAKMHRFMLGRGFSAEATARAISGADRFDLPES
jgi:regulatory protein